MADFKGEKAFYRLPKELPHYAAVGRIASEWARLEWEIDRTTWMLAGIRRPERGACITTQIGSIQNRLRALISLAVYDAMPRDIIKRLNRFYTDCGPLAIKRNRAVHDSWWFGVMTQTPGQLRLTADRALDYRFKEVKIDEIEPVIDEIRTLNEAFLKIRIAIVLERHGRRKKRRDVSRKTSRQ